MADVQDELSRCILQLLMREPFYGHLLGSITRVVTESIATAAVGLRDNQVSLLVHPGFFMKELASREERVAVIKHEALHLLFRHLFRLDRGRHDTLLFNLAADVVVNRWVEAPWTLPDSAITTTTFPDLGLDPDAPLEAHYDRLCSLRDEMRAELRAAGKNPDDREANLSSSFDTTSAPESARVLARLMGQSWHSDHRHWGERDEVGDARLDRAVEDAYRRSGRGRALNLPPQIEALIAETLAKRQPKLDWRRALRIFGSTSRRTRLVGTIRRQSKRFEAYPGIKVKRFQRLAVAVDTSGSIGPRELELVFGEIHGMWRAGAEILVLEIDDEVRRAYPYRGKFPDAVEGRGGTAFDPLFRYLHHHVRPRVDACIYLTDGYAAAPEVRPPCRLLWVITPGGHVGDHLRFGNVVQLT